MFNNVIYPILKQMLGYIDVCDINVIFTLILKL